MVDNTQANRVRKRTNIRSLIEEAFQSGQSISSVMDFYGVSYKYCLEIKQTMERLNSHK